MPRIEQIAHVASFPIFLPLGRAQAAVFTLDTLSNESDLLRRLLLEAPAAHVRDGVRRLLSAALAAALPHEVGFLATEYNLSAMLRRAGKQGQEPQQPPSPPPQPQRRRPVILEDSDSSDDIADGDNGKRNGTAETKSTVELAHRTRDDDVDAARFGDQLVFVAASSRLLAVVLEWFEVDDDYDDDDTEEYDDDDDDDDDDDVGSSASTSAAKRVAAAAAAAKRAAAKRAAAAARPLCVLGRSVRTAGATCALLLEAARMCPRGAGAGAGASAGADGDRGDVASFMLDFGSGSDLCADACRLLERTELFDKDAEAVRQVTGMAFGYCAAQSARSGSGHILSLDARAASVLAFGSMCFLMIDSYFYMHLSCCASLHCCFVVICYRSCIARVVAGAKQRLACRPAWLSAAAPHFRRSRHGVYSPLSLSLCPYLCANGRWFFSLFVFLCLSRLSLFHFVSLSLLLYGTVVSNANAIL